VQQSGDLAEMLALVAEVNDFRQLLLIKCPTLGAASTASIR
jgi:hypothetical protein